MPTLAALGLPGGPEFLIILVVVLLLFGRKIPGVARSLGRSINEFKGGLREGAEEPPRDELADQSDDASGSGPAARD